LLCKFFCISENILISHISIVSFVSADSFIARNPPRKQSSERYINLLSRKKHRFIHYFLYCRKNFATNPDTTL
jgi:hypothetical protein